jgi:tetratricopeptide (TPR) repeat protein
LEIYERLDAPLEQIQCLIDLGRLLKTDGQFDAAEEAASRAIRLIPENGNPYLVCQFLLLLGNIYQSKGETEKAVYHLEVALRIASSFNWHDALFLVHFSLAGLFLDEGRFDDARTHNKRAKSHTVGSTYDLGTATIVQACIWYRQHKLEEARSEALRATDIFEKLGAADDAEACRWFLRDIQKGLNKLVASGQSGFDREFLQTVPPLARVNSLFQA